MNWWWVAAATIGVLIIGYAGNEIRLRLDLIERHLRERAEGDRDDLATALTHLAQIRHSLELIVAELRRPAEERRRLEDEIRRQEGWERPGLHRIVEARPGETDSEAEARTRAELERKP